MIDLTHSLAPKPKTPESMAHLIKVAARNAIRLHHAPRIAKFTGQDITHHEPITYVEVSIAERLLPYFFALHPNHPREIDGVPLRYAEAPPRGSWALGTMCHYFDERLNRESRSRGTLCHITDETIRTWENN